MNLELIAGNKQLKKVDKSRLKELLQITLHDLEQSDFTEPELQARLNKLLEQTNEKPAVLFSIIRVATTWAAASPALAGALAVLGRQTVLARINNAISIL